MDKWGGFLELPDGMAEPLGNADPKVCTGCRGLHGLQRVQTARNLRSRRFRQPIEGGYMRSKGSIPSIVRPEASTRLVAEHRASRESRTAPEDCSTGHCS